MKSVGVPKWSKVLAALGLSVLFLTLGCKKPENDLGLDLLDPSDTLAVISTDTTALIAWSEKADSLTSTGLTKFVLGSYLDPIFGDVRAGFATQVLLSASNVGVGQGTAT